MSHFAEIDKDGIVLRVIVAEQDYINSGEVGDSFNWIQTSYNGNFRGRYAMNGGKYDRVNDWFTHYMPWASWTLDDTGEWQPPIAKPVELIDGIPRAFEWDEDLYQSDNSQGWIAATPGKK